jgi:choline-sulfatase
MSQKQPNILLLMADQLVPMMTGAYGHQIAHTPNLNTLAGEGVVFENAYTTCPVCVPARYSLLSGKYCGTTGCYDNGSMLGADEPTHNHYLNIAGYETVLTGKAHYIGPDQLHGFMRRLQTNYFPTSLNFMPKREKKSGTSYKELHPNPIAIDYIAENVGVRQWSLQLEFDEEAMCHALRYLGDKRSQMSGTAQKPLPESDDRPFFLQVSLNHPHEPFHVLQKHWDLYEGVEIPIPQYPDNMEETYTFTDRELINLHGSELVDLKNPDNLRALHRAYLAAVSYVDEKLGQIRQKLEDFGLADDTIIVVLSDHGDMLGHRGMVQKRTFYEYSTRIAMMYYFPPNFRRGAPGRRCSDPVSITDVAPTLLELAGINDYLPMDGRSLLPQIEGQRDPERYVFCENYSEGVTTPCLMVRKGDFKYVYVHNHETQLFNLADDPEEWRNLAGQPEYQQVVDELRGLLFQHFDPDELDRQAQASYEKRALIKQSMQKTGLPSWNYAPPLDPDKLYWRTD